MKARRSVGAIGKLEDTMKKMTAMLVAALAIGLVGCGASSGPGSAPQGGTVVSTSQTTTAGNVKFKLEGEWKEESFDQGIKFSNEDGAYIAVATSYFDSFVTESGMEAVQTYFLNLQDAGVSIGEEVIQDSVGDAPIWRYTFTSDGVDNPMSGKGVIYLTGDEMNAIQVGAPAEAYDDMEPMLDEIIDGIEYLSTEPLVTSDGQVDEVSDSPQAHQEIASSMNGGTYLVGSDISAGTYKLVATTDSGYWEIKASVGAAADIVANELFENMTYVTVEDGQYITLSDCTGQLQ